MPRYNAVIAVMACALLPLALLGNSAEHDAIVDQIEVTAETTGLSRVAHQLYRDWLNQGSHQLVSFELESRVAYTLIGACDVDCSDLHFELLRPDGRSAGRVEGPGARPVLTVEPAVAGRYQLRSTMRQCSIQPCEWGVRVYRR